jgi:hypothetical protein
VLVPQHQIEKDSNAKFEVENFNGKNNFKLWKLKMHDLLVQQELHKALAGKTKKPTGMTNEDWEDLDTRSLSTIQLSLENDVLFNIFGEGEERTIGLWSIMETLCMTKSLTNRIYLKRQLYSLQMKEGTKIVDHLNILNTLMCQLTSMVDPDYFRHEMRAEI